MDKPTSSIPVIMLLSIGISFLSSVISFDVEGDQPSVSLHKLPLNSAFLKDKVFFNLCIPDFQYQRTLGW